MNTKSILLNRILIASCFFLLFSLIQVNAQDKGIYEIDSNSNTTTSSSTIKTQNNRTDFYNLAFKRHTTVYINNSKANRGSGDGEIKKVSFTDTKSFSLLNEKVFNYAELITVKVNKVSDFNNILNITGNKNLTNLKYIYIRCNFECSETQIKNFVIANPNIRVFYKVELPS